MQDMQGGRDCETTSAAAAAKHGPSCSSNEGLSVDSRMAEVSQRAALDELPNNGRGSQQSATDASPVTLLEWATADENGGGGSAPYTSFDVRSAGKRRAFFTDEDVVEEEEESATLQVFSVDTTAAPPVETRVQPESDGIVPRVRRDANEQEQQRVPQRARRALNLLDRLDTQDGTATKAATTQAEDAVSATAPAASANQEDDLLVIRRRWKRRLAATDQAPPAAAFLSAPPTMDRRPGFARSLSSHSVFLAPPRMTFARSAAALAEDGAAVSAKIHELVLPTVRSSKHPDLNVIAPQTVAALLDGAYSDRLDGFSLIDCRFGYEFEGGSLKGAVSMTDPAQVEDAFLQRPASNSTYTALIFYCEFSANRAPKMLRHVRNLDRWIHAERYPELFYPELYLIDGGYKHCFESLKDVICQPAQYRTMDDKAFADQCKRDFALHRATWRLHKSNGCASKFQQLHRHLHDAFSTGCADDDGDGGGSGTDRDDSELLLAHPVNFRSLSQQM